MRGAVEIDPKCVNRTQMKLLRKIADKVSEGADNKGARKTVGLRLHLGPKLRKKGEMDIKARERNGARNSLQLANPPSSGEGEEEQGLLGELAKGDLRERLKGRRTKKPKNKR